MFFKKLVDKKSPKLKIDMIHNTNEDYISVTYGCIRFIDNYRFLSRSLGGLVKNIKEDDFKILKKEFPDKGKLLNKKLANPYEYFISIDDFKKPVDNLNKEDFFTSSVNRKRNVLVMMKYKEEKNFLIYLIIKMEKI